MSQDPLQRVEDWLVGRFFPFWAERAAHPRGGFRERVALNGDPIDDDVSRVRVQARQTYVFARAALMGWRPEKARALVGHGVASLLGPCRREDGLFGRMVRPGLGLSDAQPELYDNAFCAMALAWAGRALEAPALIDEAEGVFAKLDESHGHPAGGWRESLPERQPRRQNPHMHMFEASLALAEAGRANSALTRARGLLDLFETRFLDRASWTIRERLTDAFAPLPEDNAEPVEPGHAFEWVALLDQHARLANSAAPDYAAKIYEAALRAVNADGLTPMSAQRDGAPVDGSSRTWSQTEALRAHIARAAAGDAAASVRAERVLDLLFERFLDPAPPGAWIDHFDADGQPCVDAITAATGYHLVTAFTDVLARWPGAPAPQESSET